MQRIFSTIQFLKSKGFVLLFLLMPVVLRAQIEWTEHPLMEVSLPGGFSVIDLDFDGDNDVIVGSYEELGIYWLENFGNWEFAPHLVDTLTGGTVSIASADIDGDDDFDILSAGSNDLGTFHSVLWWENQGDQVFQRRIIDESLPRPNTVIVADINGDELIDLLVSDHEADAIVWFEHLENDGFQYHYVTQQFNGATNLVVSDVDGDNDQDLLCTAYWGGQMAWWENEGNGDFIEHVVENAMRPTGLVPSDLDNDADVDLIGISRGADGHLDGKLFWLENNGIQNFTRHDIITSTEIPISICPADIDADSYTDLVVGDDFGGNFYLLRNTGQEVFEEVLLATDGPVVELSCIDFDLDEDIDLILSSFSLEGRFLILENNGPTSIDPYPNPIPESLLMLYNYPNPFNSITILSFSLPHDSDVHLALFDLLGRESAIIFDGPSTAGIHNITFNAGDFPSGIYFARLTAGTESQVRKMVLLK